MRSPAAACLAVQLLAALAVVATAQQQQQQPQPQVTVPGTPQLDPQESAHLRLGRGAQFSNLRQLLAPVGAGEAQEPDRRPTSGADAAASGPFDVVWRGGGAGPFLLGTQPEPRKPYRRLLAAPPLPASRIGSSSGGGLEALARALQAAQVQVRGKQRYAGAEGASKFMYRWMAGTWLNFRTDAGSQWSGQQPKCSQAGMATACSTSA